MRRFSFRFTIRSLMIAVLSPRSFRPSGSTMPRALEHVAGRTCPSCELGVDLLLSLCHDMTVVVSLPFVVAVVLGSGSSGKDSIASWADHPPASSPRAPWLLGLMLATLPDGWSQVGGSTQGWELSSSYYTSTVIWPGDQVTPCLETMTATG